MTEARVVYYEKEGRELVSINAADPIRPSFSLSSELEKALLLSTLAESLETFVSESDPAEPFYRLARHVNLEREIIPHNSIARAPTAELRPNQTDADSLPDYEILDGILRLIPSARVGHVGLYRDPKTLTAVEYYFKVPREMSDRDAIVVDPMLATGNSAVAAVERLRETRPRSIKFVCLLTCPEGLKNFHSHHPDVPVYTAAIDSHLDEHGYIIPGLGDAGDRLYGTK